MNVLERRLRYRVGSGRGRDEPMIADLIEIGKRAKGLLARASQKNKVVRVREETSDEGSSRVD